MSTLYFGADKDNLQYGSLVFDWEQFGDLICDAKYMKLVADRDVSPVTVGGIGLSDGDYLPNGASAATVEKPTEGGYAYYKDGVLTLHDFAYAADTTASVWDHFDSVIVSYHPLTLVLEGESRIYRANDGTDNIRALYCFGDLTVTGNTLTTEMLDCGYYVWGDLVIDGATSKQPLNFPLASGSNARQNDSFGAKPRKLIKKLSHVALVIALAVFDVGKEACLCDIWDKNIRRRAKRAHSRYILVVKDGVELAVICHSRVNDANTVVSSHGVEYVPNISYLLFASEISGIYSLEFNVFLLPMLLNFRHIIRKVAEGEAAEACRMR